MYRPNRIGEAILYENSEATSSVDWAAQLSDYNSGTVSCNVINSTPLADVGVAKLNWTGTESIADNKRGGLVGQFTVVQPLNADTVGVEVWASLVGLWPFKLLITPVFGRLSSAAGSILAGKDFSFVPTIHGITTETQGWSSSVGQDLRFCSYQKRYIIRDTSSVAGIYGAGFSFFNRTGAAFDITWFQIKVGVRQFNELQAIKPNDPLR